MVNINKTFGDDWSLQANVGASISDLYSDASKVRGPIAYGEQTGYDKDGNPIYEPEQHSERLQRLQPFQLEDRPRADRLARAVAVDLLLGRSRVQGAYYLTVTGRNDWPSQLAGPNSVNSSFFYPSVGASVVLSEIIPEHARRTSPMSSCALVRIGGLAFSRFYANPTRSWNASTNSWNLSSQSPLYDLKPERTKSFEVGLTMRFLRHFNLDVSYYDTKTFNQTFNTGIPASSKYKTLYVQTGDVRNRGFGALAGLPQYVAPVQLEFRLHLQRQQEHDSRAARRLRPSGDGRAGDDGPARRRRSAERPVPAQTRRFAGRPLLARRPAARCRRVCLRGAFGRTRTQLQSGRSLFGQRAADGQHGVAQRLPVG